MSSRGALLESQLSHVLLETDVPGLGEPQRRGITDRYELEDLALLVVTDRDRPAPQEAGGVPFKGEVSTRTALWWLDVTGDIIASAVERVIDPQALLIRRTEPLSVGFAAHSFMSGWLLDCYRHGTRDLGAARLPEGMADEMALEAPVFFPVVLGADGGQATPLTEAQAVSQPGLDPALYRRLETTARELFARGRELAARRGLTLADTLYSFGRLADGSIVVDPLLHSPHLSTYRTRQGVSLPTRTLTATTEQRRESGGAYLEVGERFIVDFTPHRGPVRNRLAYSLSFVGLVA